MNGHDVSCGKPPDIASQFFSHMELVPRPIRCYLGTHEVLAPFFWTNNSYVVVFLLHPRFSCVLGGLDLFQHGPLV